MFEFSRLTYVMFTSTNFYIFYVLGTNFIIFYLLEKKKHAKNQSKVFNEDHTELKMRQFTF